ncbi:uncharacterized protein LOC143021546 [Oratosquilla oratoria]|uniref:uncharacterized protein LOC143021546 n=1 Tax=Oratosquilla oratoria TaxID=337810 RepID=UPI003F761055
MSGGVAKKIDHIDPEELWNTFKRENAKAAGEYVGEHQRSRSNVVSRETLVSIELGPAARMAGDLDQYRTQKRHTRALMRKDKQMHVRGNAEDVEGHFNANDLSAPSSVLLLLDGVWVAVHDPLIDESPPSLIEIKEAEKGSGRPYLQEEKELVGLNDRSITLLSVPGKMLANLLRIRVRSHLLKFQRSEQSGFTPVKSTTDRIIRFTFLWNANDNDRKEFTLNEHIQQPNVSSQRDVCEEIRSVATNMGLRVFSDFIKLIEVAHNLAASVVPAESDTRCYEFVSPERTSQCNIYSFTVDFMKIVYNKMRKSSKRCQRTIVNVYGFVVSRTTFNVIVCGTMILYTALLLENRVDSGARCQVLVPVMQYRWQFAHLTRCEASNMQIVHHSNVTHPRSVELVGYLADSFFFDFTVTRNRTFLRIAAETWQPYFKIEHGTDGEMTKYSGIMWHILSIIADKMNFDFEILQPPDGLWGVETDNGSWNGMLGMIDRGEVNFSLGPFAISYPRTKVADFAVPTFVMPHRLYLKRPTGTSDVSDFVRLFTPSVWWLTLASILTVGLIALAVTRTEESLEEFLAGNTKSPKYTPPSTVFATVVAIFFQGSPWFHGRGWAIRSTLCVWLLATLVLMNTYRGLLIAMLTVPSVRTPINSIQDLVDQTEVPWRLEQGGIILHTFKTANVAIYKELLKGNSGLFPDCFAARNEIADGEFAAICEGLSGDMMVSKQFGTVGKCEYFVPKEIIVTHSYTLTFSKKSTLTQDFDYWLTQLQEYGFINYWLKDTISNGTICSLPPGKEGGRTPATPLSIQQLWGLFLMGALGLGVALIVFFVELIIDRWNRN